MSNDGGRLARLDGGFSVMGTRILVVEDDEEIAASLVRRGGHGAGGVLKAGDVGVDTVAGRTGGAGRPLDLTPKEESLLVYFLRHPGQVLSRTRIYDHVWDESFDGLSNTLEVHVKEL